MSEKEYMDADYEVMNLVHRHHGPGGELPCKALTFIPSDRAERVTELDARIEQLRKIMPIVGHGAVCLSLICAAAMDWMRPGFAAMAVGGYLLWTVFSYKWGGTNA